MCEESKTTCRSSPLIQAHDAGSSSKPETIVNQVDVLVAAFVKDPHIQLVAILSYIRYSINIFHHDHRHVTLSTVNYQMVRET